LFGIALLASENHDLIQSRLILLKINFGSASILLDIIQLNAIISGVGAIEKKVNRIGRTGSTAA
jgi:hypothetical protein